MPLRHRCEYAADFPRSLPGGSCLPPREFPALTASRCAPLPAISTRFGLASNQGGVTRRFLAYSSPSRLPDPNHLVVLARPGFVGAAPTLPGTTRTRLPPAPPSCCDKISGEGLPPPLEPQRLTAHARPATHPRDARAPRGGTSSRRPGTPGPRQRRHHPRHLQPRRPRDAGRRSSTRLGARFGYVLVVVAPTRDRPEICTPRGVKSACPIFCDHFVTTGP
jgi:hypothetical protein